MEKTVETKETVVENTVVNEENVANRNSRPQRQNRKPRRFQQKEKEFEERVVTINRVTKVVGDKKGRVGFGTGKANEVPDAIRKAVENAEANLITVPIVGHGTIPHETVGNFGASKIVMRPASEGTGVIAGAAVRHVLELSGISDILAKSLGSRTPINMVRATISGLESLRTIEDVAKLRGLKISDVR